VETLPSYGSEKGLARRGGGKRSAERLQRVVKRNDKTQKKNHGTKKYKPRFSGPAGIQAGGKAD